MSTEEEKIAMVERCNEILLENYKNFQLCTTEIDKNEEVIALLNAFLLHDFSLCFQDVNFRSEYAEKCKEFFHNALPAYQQLMDEKMTQINAKYNIHLQHKDKPKTLYFKHHLYTIKIK